MSALQDSISLTDGSLLRAVFADRRYAAKRLVGLFGIQLPTAYSWFSRGVPHARREEVSAVLDLELAVQHERIIALRRHIAAERAAIAGACREEHISATAALGGGQATLLGGAAQ